VFGKLIPVPKMELLYGMDYGTAQRRLVDMQNGVVANPTIQAMKMPQ